MSELPKRLSSALSDRYRIERELGAGGMATVYLAHDLKHDRKVAIKVLKPELAAVLGADRFVQEIKTTANLQHPHILPLFDSGEADGFLFYVMPYVEGESLRERLDREGELPVEEAVRIATAVANALDYAHRHGVIHRDIKPANILLHDGQPLVADFGIALAVSAAAGGRLTETGLSLGTPYYMSPEQATAERDPDPRSDVYSLGCVLYEMLVGEPPYTGTSAQAVLGKILTTDPVRPTEHRRTIPTHVEAAVLKALEKRPADRFSTPGHFLEALAHASSMTGIAPRGVGSRANRWNRATSAFAAMTVLLAATLVWFLKTTPRAQEDRRVLHLPLTIDNPVRSRSTWTDGIRISPEGSRLAYYTSEGWILLDLLTGTSRPVSPEFGGLHLAFSPGGDSVSLSSGGRMQQVVVADLATGRAVQIADCCGRISVWNQDGWVYHQDLNLQVVRTRSDGTAQEVVVPVFSDSSSLPFDAMPVPGGHGVVFVRMPPGGTDPSLAEIMVKDDRSDSARVLMKGVTAKLTSSGHLLAVRADGTLFATRFDAEDLALIGAPVPVLEDVLVQVEGVYRPRAVFDVSEEGTAIYVKQRPLVEDTVVIMDRGGEPLDEPVTWGGWVNHIVRSRDGSRWAASVHPGLMPPSIWIRDGASVPPRRLTFTRNLDYWPMFSPDGDSVLFVGFLGSTVGTNWDLLRVPFSGAGQPERILDYLRSDIREPRLTSDGRWVVFCTRADDGQSDVIAHRFGPDSLTLPVEATSANECSPDVSPNGRWIAFESAETGRNEVYIRPFPDVAVTRWQVTSDGAPGAPGRSPRWSSDGRELYFLSPRNELVAVPIVEGSTPAFGIPRVLFALDDHTFWSGEVLPEGQGFVMIRREVGAPGQVVMIRNFFELLKEKVG